MANRIEWRRVELQNTINQENFKLLLEYKDLFTSLIYTNPTNSQKQSSCFPQFYWINNADASFDINLAIQDVKNKIDSQLTRKTKDPVLLILLDKIVRFSFLQMLFSISILKSRILYLFAVCFCECPLFIYTKSLETFYFVLFAKQFFLGGGGISFHRHMRGGRVVSCKSAKDRTGMAITFEQVYFLFFSFLPTRFCYVC